jgi:hypothetical protein
MNDCYIGREPVVTPVYKSIEPDVEFALGAVVSEECRRLDLSPWTVAIRGDFAYSTIKAFKRGKRQPNLAAFIALAWSLHEEPRELFDKLLNAMRLPPGTRPVLTKS